jgi:hypothetical protein
VEAVAVVGLEVRIGRLLAEAVDRLREVAVVDDEGIARFRMRVESFRDKDVRAQVHRAAPELRETLALDPLVRTYFVAGASGMGGIVLSSVISTGAAAAGSTVTLRGVL